MQLQRFDGLINANAEVGDHATTSLLESQLYRLEAMLVQ